LSQYNPLINAVKNNSRVKVIFTGPQGYISPRWHNEQIVPTWNYATVSLICQLTFIENNTDKLKAMADISQHFDPQWDFNEFSQEKNHKVVQQMLSAITVFQLTIIEVDSKFKLSQNRSMECRRAFEKNLRLVDNNSLADIQI
jgi:transcriptional regulator